MCLVMNSGFAWNNSTEVNGHLNNLQDDLESLKDLLRSDILALDNNTLLSVSANKVCNSADYHHLYAITQNLIPIMRLRILKLI